MGSGGDWAEECKWCDSCWRLDSQSNHISKVFRVSWLKAKARYDRWNEELQMVEGDTASISQCFMTKHFFLNRRKRYSLIYNFIKQKRPISYRIFFVFLFPRHDLRSFLMLGL